MSDNAVADTTSARYTGRVKWFNNKAGYGFITVTDTLVTSSTSTNIAPGTDVFVHHSAINVAVEQYKYLVQGEYVEFSVSPVSSGQHEFQCDSVSGIKDGKLMCETRRDVRSSRVQYSSSKSVETVTPRESRSATSNKPQKRGQGPRSDQTASEQGEWKKVSTPRKNRGRPPLKTTNQ
jgi:cold shock CspA family protein